MKTKQDLIDTVIKQIELDVDCRDYTAIEELVQHLPMDVLVEYLPIEDWGKFKHLRKEDGEIRTENALTNLITQFPNDQELGKQIRMRWQKK
jgi:hypothetical protein